MNKSDNDGVKEENENEEIMINFDDIDKPIPNLSISKEDSLKKNIEYIKYTFLQNIKINILIIILSLALFISEMKFRDPLFEFSLDFEKNWQNYSSDFTITFFKIISKVCGEYLMPVPLIFILCFFPLIKSSFYIAGLIFCLHFHSLMKIWYGNERPFWIKNELFKGICDAGFGNPSGHSISAVYLYLTLFSYISETKILKGKYIIKIFLFIFFLTYIILIILSRLILGIHSINQVIYGSALGVINYAVIIHMFKLHKMPIVFYKKFFKQRIIVYCISLILLLLEILSILSCLAFNSKFKYKTYSKIIDNLCGENYPEYRRFNLDGLFGAFVILSLLGMYMGQVLFWYLIDNRYKKNKIKESKNIECNVNELEDDYDEKKNYKKLDELINNWNDNRSLAFLSFSKLLKLVLILIMCLSPLSLFILVPKNTDVAVIFVFKFGIPFFLLMFLTFSFGFYNIIELSLGSKEDLLKTNEKKSHEIQLI
jgi:membrane-associated phospholipid phosphatase